MYSQAFLAGCNIIRCQGNAKPFSASIFDLATAAATQRRLKLPPNRRRWGWKVTIFNRHTVTGCELEDITITGKSWENHGKMVI